ncbi:hypothetical protein [Deinococcus daejeonensis]|uniref:DUF5666 domain-containing protein n=1 Tax=Deinococcus daejeonensis TaxID=1007098 RepID=A0ABQ2IUB7_9DEIO|nr:hypothetical protein [Deinococcus daejeonensis]GGN27686.1 hypothetical protein GCM10010842_00800 [Deinococcus daejeonensis]
MKIRTLLCAALLALSPAAQANSPQPITLKLLREGVLVSGTLKLARSDELLGVWSSSGRARLMRCEPRCKVVPSLAVPGLLTLGPDARARVVLGGTFKVGQRVGLVFRLKNSQILSVQAVVTR